MCLLKLTYTFVFDGEVSTVLPGNKVTAPPAQWMEGFPVLTERLIGCTLRLVDTVDEEAEVLRQAERVQAVEDTCPCGDVGGSLRW